MIKAYINYPHCYMELHAVSTCSEIGKRGKLAQRKEDVTIKSFAATADKLAGRNFRLGSNASINDIWLSVNFDDVEFEEAVAEYLYRSLGKRYEPLQHGVIKRHDCKGQSGLRLLSPRCSPYGA